MAMGEYGTKWESKTFPDLGYADDLSIFDESVCKMNQF
jgi:hypothetical protein